MNKTKQQLITGFNLNDWQSFVNKFMLNGWKVVPGTVQASPIYESSSYTDGVYAIVIEKEVDK